MEPTEPVESLAQRAPVLLVHALDGDGAARWAAKLDLFGQHEGAGLFQNQPQLVHGELRRTHWGLPRRPERHGRAPTTAREPTPEALDHDDELERVEWERAATDITAQHTGLRGHEEQRGTPGALHGSARAVILYTVTPPARGVATHPVRSADPGPVPRGVANVHAGLAEAAVDAALIGADLRIEVARAEGCG